MVQIEDPHDDYNSENPLGEPSQIQFSLKLLREFVCTLTIFENSHPIPRLQ